MASVLGVAHCLAALLKHADTGLQSWTLLTLAVYHRNKLTVQNLIAGMWLRSERRLKGRNTQMAFACNMVSTCVQLHAMRPKHYFWKVTHVRGSSVNFHNKTGSTGAGSKNDA